MKARIKNPTDVFQSAPNTASLVKSWRTNFEIPQEEMALACGISQANFSAIENGRREVGPRIALRLASYMGVSPELILYPSGFKSEPEYKEVQKRVEQVRAMTKSQSHPQKRTSRLRFKK